VTASTLDGLDVLFDRLDTTGCIVTTAHQGQVAACFVSFLTMCSMDPPRLLVCTSHENLTHGLVERSGVLAVHPVGRDQPSWVRHFGMQSGRDVDKLAMVRWRPGVTGSPVLVDAMGVIEGRVLSSLDCGDHTARLVEPVYAAVHESAAEPLTMLEVLDRGLDGPRNTENTQ
jgi:flavin reductase (DIM6/NTAB) family NADH-FMN oxidoreductase RutF